MGIIKEFQEFAVKGNVVDMAVGIIIGGAFGTIVKSLDDAIIGTPYSRMWGAYLSGMWIYRLGSGRSEVARV